MKWFKCNSPCSETGAGRGGGGLCPQSCRVTTDDRISLPLSTGPCRDFKRGRCSKNKRIDNILPPWANGEARQSADHALDAHRGACDLRSAVCTLQMRRGYDPHEYAYLVETICYLDACSRLKKTTPRLIKRAPCSPWGIKGQQSDKSYHHCNTNIM